MFHAFTTAMQSLFRMFLSSHHGAFMLFTMQTGANIVMSSYLPFPMHFCSLCIQGSRNEHFTSLVAQKWTWFHICTCCIFCVFFLYNHGNIYLRKLFFIIIIIIIRRRQIKIIKYNEYASWGRCLCYTLCFPRSHLWLLKVALPKCWNYCRILNVYFFCN